jgi:hypothetical protein
MAARTDPWPAATAVTTTVPVAEVLQAVRRLVR